VRTVPLTGKRHRRWRGRRRCLTGVLLLTGVHAVGAQDIQWEGGVLGSTGTYLFTERTNSLGFSTGLALRSGRLTIRVTQSAWLQNTLLVTPTGTGSVPTGGPGGREAVRDSGQARRGSGPGTMGLVALLANTALDPDEASLTGYELHAGDLIASAMWRWLDGADFVLSGGVGVKAPVASADDIGAGRWDAGVIGAALARLAPRWTLGLDASWWHLGDLDSLEIRDPLSGSATVGALVGDRWAVLAGVSASTRYLTGFDPPASASLAILRRGTAGNVGLSLSAGLTETAPDLSAGVTWSVPLRSERRF